MLKNYTCVLTALLPLEIIMEQLENNGITVNNNSGTPVTSVLALLIEAANLVVFILFAPVYP